MQGVVDADAFARVCRDGGQAGCLPRLPVFAFGLEVAVQRLLPGGEQHDAPALDFAVAAVFCALNLPRAVQHGVGGLRGGAGACLADFVQYQQAVVTGGGGVAEAVCGAFPGQFQPFGVAPYRQGKQRGGGFAVRAVAVEVKAAAFVVEQV